MFENQNGENAGAFTRDHLATLAGMVGLDKAAFLAGLDDADLVAAVKAETASGTQLGIDSTPTLVIDGVLHKGLPTWAQLSSLIDSAAAASPGASASRVPAASPSPAALTPTLAGGRPHARRHRHALTGGRRPPGDAASGSPSGARVFGWPNDHGSKAA